MSRAVVIGGGLAGITAAFALRDRGHQVELCEARGWLGGRAFTSPTSELSYPIDNGPHVMLGCYVQMRALLRRLGTEHEFEVPSTLRLCYADPDGRISRLRLPPGPAPLTMPFGLALLPALGWGDKVRAMRGLGAVLRGAPPEQTVEDWIDARGQRGAPRSYLWDPMCRAILNAEPDRVDAALFLSTLRRAFLGSGSAAAIWLPRRPWSAILGDPARARLQYEGVRVSGGHRLVEIEVVENRIASLRFANGQVREVSSDTVVVSALPWHVFGKLLPGGAPAAAAFDGSPIVSVYFDLDGDPGLPPDSLIALVDGEPFHFLCRRPGAPPGAFAVLSGGGVGLGGLPVAGIESAARAQLAKHFPGATGLDGGRARVVKEARATALLAPGSSPDRPASGARCGLANLRVVGDWTGTGLPSTLEGAVVSGRAAAED